MARNLIPPSKSKREITKITNTQNTKRHMVNRVGSSFPKDGHSATQTELKWHERNVTKTLTPKTDKREPQQNYRMGTVSNELLGS